MRGDWFDRFPHLHLRLRSPPISCSSLDQGLLAAVFELDRTHVIQRRVHAFPVIPEQPVKHRILGLADGFKALAVQPFHLQRSELIGLVISDPVEMLVFGQN